jgi:D-mannonate dehydratase
MVSLVWNSYRLYMHYKQKALKQATLRKHMRRPSTLNLFSISIMYREKSKNENASESSLRKENLYTVIFLTEVIPVCSGK